MSNVVRSKLPAARQKFDRSSNVNTSFIENGHRVKGAFTVAKARLNTAHHAYEYQLVDGAGNLYKNGAWIREKDMRMGDRNSPPTRSKATGQPTRLASFASDTSTYQHFIPAFLNEISISAFPDSGSDFNIVSAEFIGRHGLLYDGTATQKLYLPNGEYLETLGTISLPFRFPDFSEVFRLDFVVIRDCVCDVLIGDQFLSRTKTFTSFKSRIHRMQEPKHHLIPRVCSAGTPARGVVGTLNGHRIVASPDSGSEINVISKQLADELGLNISIGPQYTMTLELVDKSHVQTCGLATHVQWRFGSQETAPRPSSSSGAENIAVHEFGTDATPTDIFVCDFHIVDGLARPLILSAQLLYGTNAFTAYLEFIGKNLEEFPADKAGTYAIQKKKKTFKEIVKSVFSSASAGPQLDPSKTLLEHQKEEIIRRTEEDDRIEELPASEQATARDAETQYREQWDAWYASQASV